MSMSSTQRVLAGQTLHMRLSKLAKEAQNHFLPSGNTDNGLYTVDGTGEAFSTRILPEPNELLIQTTAHTVDIIREWDTPEGPEKAIIASASKERVDGTDIDLLQLANNWIEAYAMASRPMKAEMCQVNDLHLTRGDVEAALSRASNTNSHRTVTLSPTEAEGVQMGTKETNGKTVKRLTWHGHSGFGLARYLGANGWTGAEATETFKRIGLPMGKTAIIGGVYAGKSGKRGEPAKVTAAQRQTLDHLLAEIRKAKAEAAPKAKAEPKVEAKQVEAKVEAPTQAEPKAKGRGSKRKAADAKVAAEVAKRKAAKAKK